MTATAPRMAPADPFEGKQRPAQSTVHCYSLKRISRAAWDIATVTKRPKQSRLQRRKRQAICPNR